MDTSPFANMPFEYAQAMYLSFLASQKTYDDTTKSIKTELDAAKAVVDKLEVAYSESTEAAQRYTELIADLTTQVPSLVKTPPPVINVAPQVLPQFVARGYELNASDVANSNELIGYAHGEEGKNKRLRYPVKLTDKLLELIEANGVVGTDEELTDQLQHALDLPVPFKTAQNKLWELGKEGYTKRVRGPKTFINGLPAWFDGNRVKPEHLPSRVRNETAPTR